MIFCCWKRTTRKSLTLHEYLTSTHLQLTITSGAVCQQQLADPPASLWGIGSLLCALLRQSVGKFGQRVDHQGRKAYMASARCKALEQIVHKRIFMAGGQEGPNWSQTGQWPLTKGHRSNLISPVDSLAMISYMMFIHIGYIRAIIKEI